MSRRFRVSRRVGTRKAPAHPILDAAPVASRMDFEALVDAYYRPLYQFAMSLTRREAEASDMTQQTFAIWADKGHQLRDPSKVKTWLFTTLHREFLNTHRKQQHFRHDELDEERGDLPFVEPKTEQRLDATIVLDALARLSEAYQAPLSLFYLEEHSYHEIAEILEIPIGTVQSRISRGKAQLQRMLMERDSLASDTKRGDCG
jgi:RNA polymerase sigma factor (sigma-70 family)